MKSGRTSNHTRYSLPSVTTNQLGNSVEVGTLLDGERQVLEMIATGAPLASVLDALCRFIDARSGLMSALFLLDADGTRLTQYAGPHLPEVWRQATKSVPLTAAGSCGTAVRHRERVIVPEISVDPTYEAFRELARVAGMAAVWSTPLYANDHRVLGTFAVYSATPGTPSDENLQLVERATHLASIAVERHLTEEALRQSERRFAAAFHASPITSTINNFADGRFIDVNAAFVRTYGYDRDAVIGQTALTLGLYVDPSRRAPLIAMLEHGPVRNVEVQARSKSGRILDLLVSMDRIDIRGEACLLATEIDVTDRKRAEEELRRSERLLRLVVDALPVGVAVMNRAGDIILSNPASEQIWSRSIPSGHERYVESKAWWHATGKRIAPDEWASKRALVDGETSVNEVIEIEAFDGKRKIIQNSAVPIRDAKEHVTGAVVVNEDISARKTSERELNESYSQLRALTTRLMRAQDDERRRIAQMLHETTAQDLAALKMLLARLNRTSDHLDDSERSVVADSIALADQSMTEIRTLSYLLHPPFLDETGLLPALRWYAAGFAERSGIKVDLDLPEHFDRLPVDTETALFRIVQESLINIHRHAGSETARIRMRREADTADTLVLEIEDRGHGFPEASLNHITSGGGGVGVGIAGMSERIDQLGGRLEIESDAHGATVRVRLPIVKDAE